MLDQPLPPSLAQEGGSMLAALIRDLAAIPAIRVIASRDSRLCALPLPAETLWPEPGETAFALFTRGVLKTDATWPIAPESGGTLEKLSQQVLNKDKVLLGSSPDSVNLTGSKLRTSHYLAGLGLPVVQSFSDPRHAHDCPTGWVVKPDDGAGCLDTLFFPHRHRMQEWWDDRAGGKNLVVQPFIPGEAMSLSLICTDGYAQILSCNRQHVVVQDGQFHYLGCEANVRDARVYAALANQIARALPGLRGYVGVDFVQNSEGYVVMEINPRLTGSYADLSKTLGYNPASRVLDLILPAMRGVPMGAESRA
jgi:predicted ATP-grasp superfamily ATP-dependent carboligase